MNKLFTLSSSEYDAISFRSKYLYQDFNAVRSVLFNEQLSQLYINQLLEPKLNGNNIEWYGNYSGDFVRIANLEESKINQIRKKFSVFKNQTDEIINKLSASKDKDSKEWGRYFVELFNPDSIILLGNPNSDDWVMLWGFKFNTGMENLIPGGKDLLGPSKPNEGNNSGINIEEDSKETIVNNNTEEKKEDSDEIESDPIRPKEEEVDDDDEKEEIIAEPSIPVKGYKIGFWGRIKRWLRWISYRFWGLFWIIIYTLLIIWLCKFCNKPNCDDYCNEMKKTKKELERLEERVRERCDTSYIKGR